MHHKGGKQIKFAPGVKSAGNTKGRVGFKGKIRDWAYVDGPKATRRAWEIGINVIYTK